MARISERQTVTAFVSESDLRSFIRVIRKQFQEIYSRDVPGYFIRKIAQNCGLSVNLPETTKAKTEYAFDLMDKNEHYRSNKSDLARALEVKFKEHTLGYIVEDIFQEWHGRDTHPAPSENVDIQGQGSLFE